MPTIEEFDQWYAKQNQAESTQAGFILDDAKRTDPDQYAADAKLGFAMGMAPGAAAVARDTLQKQLDQLRESSILANSPRTAQWVRENEQIKAGWDDLDNMSWFEGFAHESKNLGIRMANRAGQMYNQARMEHSAERKVYRKQTFGEILDSNRDFAKSMKPGEPDLPLFPTIGDVLTTSLQYLDARAADLRGVDDEAREREAAAGAGANLKRMDEVPQGGITREFQQLAFPSDKSGSETVGAFASELYRNPVGGLTWLLQMFGDNAPQLVAGAAVTAATKNPMAGAAIAGGTSYMTERFTSPAEFLQEKGIDLRKPEDIERLINNPALLKDAADRGILRGMIIGAFDAGSMGLAGKVLSKSPAGEALAQALQEAVSGAGGEYLARQAAGQKSDWGSVLAEGFGSVATMPIDIGISGRRIFSDRVAARNGGEAQTLINAVSEKAQESKLRRRLDTAFNDFVSKATHGTAIENLYVSAAKLQELFQSLRYDPQTFLADIPGVHIGDYRTALASGGDVKLPVAAYASKLAGTDLDAVLRPHMKFSPEDMTATEAVTFNGRAQDIEHAVFLEAEKENVSEGEKRSVDIEEYEELVARLRHVGMPLEVAKREALPMIAMRRTMSERGGIDAAEFARRYPLPQVKRAAPQELPLRNVDILSRELSEMRDYVAKRPNKKMSLLEAIDDFGGINDVGGDLKARNVAVINRGRGKKTLRLARAGTAASAKDVFVGSAGRKYGIDDVAHAMFEAGYLQDHPVAAEYHAALESGQEVPNLSKALLDSIDEELRGNIQYAGGTAVDERAAVQERNISYLDELGVSLNNTDDVILAALEKSAAESGQIFNQASLRKKKVKLRKSMSDLLDFSKATPHGETRTVEIATVSDAVADLVEQQVGVDIHGYRHTIDTSAIRHIMKSHGNAESEARRGMVAITDSDILHIPELIASADKIVTGAKNRRGEELIGYLKTVEDGTTLYIEEVRRGRKTLSAVSMRKYPATIDSSSIAKTISPNVRNDGGNDVIISDVPPDSKTLFQHDLRGSIRLPLSSANDGNVIISLFESADLSTFLHETGHYFLHTLQNMRFIAPDVWAMYGDVRSWWIKNAHEVAKDGAAATGVVVNADHVKAFLKKGTTGDVAIDAAVDVGMHEQFARAFEAYLMEGRAPSIELREVFKHLAEWLTRIYKNLRGLDIKASPELRKVFERMLATDAAIKEARDDMSAGMLFTGGKTALSADEHRRLRRLHEAADDEAHQKLRRQVMKPIFLSRQAWYRKERETVKAISTRSLQAVPIYQAIQALRFGTDFDGKPVGRIKLDRDILERDFGLKPLSSESDGGEDELDHANAFAGRDGIHPDIAAGMYGFDSGRTFLQALVRARPIELAIELLTERTMVERHGDLLLDGQLEEEALKALHGDKRRAFLLAELNALSQLSGGEVTTRCEVEGNVHRLFSALKVSSATDFDRHLAAERKGAAEAAEAFAKDDLSQAAEAKRRQLMACHFYMAASAKADELEALIDRMATLDAMDDERAGGAEADDRQAVRALAAKFGLASKPVRFDMDGWLEQMKEDDLVL